jgi:hypothetical protein
LLHAGYDFPHLGRIEGGAQSHRHISAYFRGALMEFPAGFGPELRKFKPEAHNCILSSEDFYYLHGKNLERFASFFGKKSKIICFIRHPYDHIRALYYEMIKGTYHKPLQNLVDKETKSMRGKGFSYYAYQRNLGEWQSLFDDVTCLYLGEDAVQQFLDAAGIDISILGNTRLNDRQPDYQIALHRHLNMLLDQFRYEGGLARRLKREKMAQIDCAALFKDRVVYDVADLSDFMKVFQEIQPEEKIVEDDASVIRYPSMIEATDEELIDLFEITPQRPRSEVTNVPRRF